MAPVPPDLDPLCRLAVELARGAGALISAGRAESGGQVAVKSTPTDVVTAMDLASECYLAAELARLRPDDAVLGEEGFRKEGTSGVRWIVDPIDGTVNYLYGIPAYAVSVAAEVRGVVSVGAVYNPASGELFQATLGGGAWCGGQRLRCSSESDLGQALISTGFSYDAERRREQAAVLATLLPRIRDVRRMGSAALDLCQVAAGRLDGHYEEGLAPWDHAAGGLIAAESGAVVAGLRGQPAGPDCLVSAGPALFPRLVAELEALIPPPG
ncbi:MAG: inositol monophosphatase family protein [Geodermatophilaceae bacterium]